MRWQEEAQQTREGFKTYLKAELGAYNTVIEDAIKRTLPGCDHPILFCSACATHEQKEHDVKGNTHGGCKNLIGEIKKDPADGRFKFYTITQCACQGPAHGTLEGW